MRIPACLRVCLSVSVSINLCLYVCLPIPISTSMYIKVSVSLLKSNLEYFFQPKDALSLISYLEKNLLPKSSADGNSGNQGDDALRSTIIQVSGLVCPLGQLYRLYREQL